MPFMWNQLSWVMGDASKLWSVHDGKAWTSRYVILKVLESVFRGFGQVCFANNPWSGILVLAGLVVADPLVGLAALVASLSSLCMSRLLDQPDSAVVSGLQNYSAVLVGSVTLSLFPFFFEGSAGITVWALVVAMAALSVIVGIGLGVLLSPNKLPVYTLPFNVATSLLFLSLHSAGFSLQPTVNNSTALYVDAQIEWDQVFVGVLKSAGQVYAVETSLGSILILFALAIYSPFLTGMSFLGGLISSLVGLFITAPSYGAVYAGVWGYNGFLASGCIAFFVSPNATSILVAFINAIFAAFIQGGLVPIFQQTQLPVFTFPFCLASLIFLATAEAVPGLERVSNLTFPEKHFWTKRKEDARIRKIKCSTSDSNDEAMTS